MTVDPDSLSERQRSVSRSELKMDDQQSIEETAEIDPQIAEEFDL